MSVDGSMRMNVKHGARLEAGSACDGGCVGAVNSFVGAGEGASGVKRAVRQLLMKTELFLGKSL
jgi:hypothetical protein